MIHAARHHEWLAIVEYCGENDIKCIYDWTIPAGKAVALTRKEFYIAFPNPLTPTQLVGVGEAVKAAQKRWEEFLKSMEDD